MGFKRETDMPGPGMDLIGEEEIQEVLDVLRGGYLFRYGISLGAEVDPRFKGKVYRSSGKSRTTAGSATRWRSTRAPPPC